MDKRQIKKQIGITLEPVRWSGGDVVLNPDNPRARMKSFRAYAREIAAYRRLWPARSALSAGDRAMLADREDFVLRVVHQMLTGEYLPKGSFRRSWGGEVRHGDL